MQKILAIIIALGMLIPAWGQVQIGDADNAAMNKSGKLTNEQIAQLKKSTTVFVVPFRYYMYKDQYEKQLKSAWTLSPFHITTPDSISHYLNATASYTFFTIQGGLVQVNTSRTTSNYPRIWYELWLPNVKNKKVKSTNIARMLLHTDIDAMRESIEKSNYGKKAYSEHMLNYLYNETEFFNFTPGILAGYIHYINEKIEAQSPQGLFKQFEDKARLSALAKDTLYIPDYVFNKLSPITGKQKADIPSNDDIAKDYPYPFRVVSQLELELLLAQNNRPLHYLMHLQNNTNKFVQVFSTQPYQMIYADVAQMSFNFGLKDLRKIAKMVK